MWRLPAAAWGDRERCVAIARARWSPARAAASTSTRSTPPTTTPTESCASLRIDGQYFFGARYDPNISDVAFEGIKAYPPVPTTEPDAVLKSPVSVSNMQSLLHSYQHDGDGAALRRCRREADVVADLAGTALENQSRRLMLDQGAPLEHLGKSSRLLLSELTTPNVREKGLPGKSSRDDASTAPPWRSGADLTRCCLGPAPATRASRSWTP